MRVSVERLPGSTVEVDIIADDAEFADALDKTYKKIAREVTIPGFRRGKAPRNVLERMVGRDAIVDEAGREMMDDLYRRAMEQESLVPVGDPRVGITQQEPIGFKVVVEVYPTATLGDYRDVRVEPREVDVTEDEVNEVVEQFRKRHATWEDIEVARMPIDSDMVVLDYQIFEGEEPFIEPVVGETYVLGESQLFDALADAIRMMMLGTTAELTLAFDEDDLSAAPHVRGKELRYVVTLKEHKRRILPDADAELAKQANPEFETFDQMLEQIRKDLLRNKAMQARSEVVTDVINAMAETSAIEVPRALVEREIDDEITQFRSRLAQQRMTLEEYLDGNGQTQEEFREEIAPNAERRVRNSIVLQEIAKAEGFEVSEEDISGEIDRMTVGSQNPERLRAIYESDHFRGLLESEMFDRKLQELVVGIATEGRGAVTGPGAEALKAELEPPTPAEPATMVEVEGEPVDDESAAGDEDITIIEFAGEDLEAAPEPDAAQDAEAADSVDSERRDEADVEATSVSLAEQDAEQAKPV